MIIQIVAFDHPDATRLDGRVQREYQERYGDGKGDVTPLAPEMFEPPHGLYLVVYDDEGAPVATGGWRTHDASSEGDGGADEQGYVDGDAEIKRMYVVPEARGGGLSRLVLAALEEDARAAGRIRMVLETGVNLTEAVALYTSSGYAPCAKFGPYRFHELSRCYAKSLTAPTVGPAAGPAIGPAAATTVGLERAAVPAPLEEPAPAAGSVGGRL